MNNHLSQDQMSRWILGNASPEEAEHGRNCPECTAELNQFREALSTFQGVMKHWSEQEIAPKLAAYPQSGSSRRGMQWPAWRWSIAGAAAVALMIIPIYRHSDLFNWTSPEAVSESAAVLSTGADVQLAETNADVQLMEAVTSHLSRPLPAPMERVMALFPVQEVPDSLNKTETRDASERLERPARKDLR